VFANITHKKTSLTIDKRDVCLTNHSAAEHSTAWHSAAQNGTARHSTALLHSTARHAACGTRHAAHSARERTCSFPSPRAAPLHQRGGASPPPVEFKCRLIYTYILVSIHRWATGILLDAALLLGLRAAMYDVRCTMHDARCTMYDVR
jgi:hypothetical protein